MSIPRSRPDGAAGDVVGSGQTAGRAGWNQARGLGALQEIAGLVTADDDRPEFVGRLSATVARLVGAERVILFLLQADGTVAAQPGGFGISPDLIRQLSGIPCTPKGEGLLDQIVFGDLVFRARTGGDSPELAPYRAWLEMLGAETALAVAWRAGDVPLGALAAYNAAGGAGFSDEDEWVLQVSAVAAGLVWQQRRLTAQFLEVQATEVANAHALAERMTALERTKSDLLNLAAHELRGPLAVIRGYLSMIEDGSLSGANLSRLLPTLLGKAQQMDALVTQMLEAARLEEGLLKLDLTVFDLRMVVRQAVDAAGLLSRPGQWVTFDQPSTPVMLEGDPARIGTVVSNLIDNALKYSPEGGPVGCSIRVPGNRATVLIRDRGLGIAAADMPLLFTRFGRILTAENSHIGGTGLGLHICRVLARLHGGDITVESEVGKGSVFTLTLPLSIG